MSFYFPPEKDEIFFNYIRRFIDQYGYYHNVNRSLHNMLHGIKANPIGVFFQEYLKLYADFFNAPETSVLHSPESILYNMTVYGFSKRFLSEEEKIVLRDSFDKRVLKAKPFIANTGGGVAKAMIESKGILKMCPKCIEEGKDYFNVRHMTPGNYMCTEHNIPLVYYDIPRGYKKPFTPYSKKEGTGKILFPIDEGKPCATGNLDYWLRVSQFIDAIYDNEIEDPINIIKEKINSRINEKGKAKRYLTDRDYISRYPDIKTLIVNSYMNNVQINTVCFNEDPFELMRLRHSRGYEYIFLMAALFSSVKEYNDYKVKRTVWFKMKNARKIDNYDTSDILGAPPSIDSRKEVPHTVEKMQELLDTTFDKQYAVIGMKDKDTFILKHKCGTEFNIDIYNYFNRKNIKKYGLCPYCRAQKYIEEAQVIIDELYGKGNYTVTGKEKDTFLIRHECADCDHFISKYRLREIKALKNEILCGYCSKRNSTARKDDYVNEKIDECQEILKEVLSQTNTYSDVSIDTLNEAFTRAAKVPGFLKQYDFKQQLDMVIKFINKKTGGDTSQSRKRKEA